VWRSYYILWIMHCILWITLDIEKYLDQRGVTSAFEGMAFKAFQKRYSAQYERLLFEKWRKRSSQGR
jgi:hypothetical protein